MKKLLFFAVLLTALSSSFMCNVEDDKTIEKINSLKLLGLPFFNELGYTARGGAFKDWYKNMDDEPVMNDGEMLTYLPDTIDEEFKKKEIGSSELIVPGWWRSVQ